MFWLKQSTAYTLKLGPFVDETDGFTAEAGLTISQADVRLSKNGAAFAQKNDATACTHNENGYYGCPINATDTALLGRLIVAVHESGARPVRHEFMVVPSAVYEALTNTTGFKLAADGLDAITITEPSGPASNFREMVVQIWRRFFKKATMTSTQLKTYKDDDSTIITTQACAESGGLQIQGQAT